MANKIDTMLDAVETALNELVGTGVLITVERGVINPLKVQQVPVVGLIPSEVIRRGGEGSTADWEVRVLLMLCTRADKAAADQTVTDLMAEITAKIDALNATDSPGGVIDMPRWDFWYRFDVSRAPVGAWATLRIMITGALKTA